MNLEQRRVGLTTGAHAHGGAGRAVGERIGDEVLDDLRQAIGEHFDIVAEVLRLGSRVANTRMEFRGPEGKLMATGAGAYIIS